MKAYRFVTEDLKSEHGDVQWVVGEWQKYEGTLKLCKSGFHASRRPLDSLNYIFGTRWFLCETKGKALKDTDKLCASEMRILQEIPLSVIVQFATDCAKRVDARDAAWAAIMKDAREAAAAAWAAREAAAGAAREAAAGAAREAAAAAAWAAREAAAAAWAAREAAGDAEEKWQNNHLTKLIRQAFKEQE